MNWIPPKLDWSREDYYNAEDLNRVENNIGVVHELIQVIATINPITIITDRVSGHIPYADEINRVEFNLECLSTRYKPPEWLNSPGIWVPTIQFDYEDARRYEYNLNLLYLHYRGTIDSLNYCGAYICGEGGI